MTTPLRKLRKDRGWTVEDLAVRASVSVSLIYAHERYSMKTWKGTTPSLKLSTARKIAGALGVPVSDILEVK